MVLSTECCCLEENYDTQHSFVLDDAIKKQNFPLPHRMYKGQTPSLGSGKDSDNLLVSLMKGPLTPPTLQGSSYVSSATVPLHESNVVNNETFEIKRFLLGSFSKCMLSYCVQLTKILTSEGHVFNQELAFCLLGVPCPIFLPQQFLCRTDFA